VKAVVTYDGVANMRTFWEDDATAPQRLFGVDSLDDPIVAGISPITHLSKEDAPFLIFASDSRSGDFVRQAEELYEGLKAAGASAELRLVKNAEHCGPGSLSEIGRLNLAVNFFDQTLK